MNYDKHLYYIVFLYKKKIIAKCNGYYYKQLSKLFIILLYFPFELIRIVFSKQLI